MGWLCRTTDKTARTYHWKGETNPAHVLTIRMTRLSYEVQKTYPSTSISNKMAFVHTVYRYHGQYFIISLVYQPFVRFKVTYIKLPLNASIETKKNGNMLATIPIVGAKPAIHMAHVI